MNHDELLEHFPGVRPNGHGMVANCPNCGDTGHHLSIRQAEDGKTLLHCFHGCDPKEILKGAGLNMKYLYPSNGHSDNTKPKYKRTSDTKQYEGDPLKWLGEHCQVPLEFLKTLPIEMQGDSVVFSFGPGLRNKVRQAGTHELFWDTAPNAQELPCPPIWPMPGAELPAEIWLAESETDWLPLRYTGLPAYAVTKGAGTLLTYEHAQSLYSRGLRRAILVYDADKAGRDGAEKQAKALAEAGIEAGIVDLAEAGLVDPLKGQKDLRDAWRSCLDRDKMRGMLEGLAATTSKGGVVVATRESPFLPAPELTEDTEGSTIQWQSLLGVEGLVGRGIFTLFSARPKAGKTTLISYAAKDWLRQGLRVAWLTEEPKAKWKERISKLGLCHENLLLAFPSGFESVKWAEQLRQVRPDVIVVDTARTFLGIPDENDAATVHKLLWPVVLVARELDAVLIVLHHRRKSDGDEGTDHSGSHAYVGDCDIALTLREGTEPRRRQLQCRSRFDDSPEKLLLELSADGVYQVLGRPEEVTFEEVKRRMKLALTADWQNTADLLEGLDAPKPGRESARKALHELATDGEAERQPGRGNKGDQWRLTVPHDVGAEST